MSAVEEALRARKHRRVTVRWTASFAAAAAAGLVVWLGATNPAWRAFSTPTESTGRVGAPPAAAPVAPILAEARPRGMTMQAGLQLAASASSEVRIDGADGTALTLEPGGSLAVIEAGATRRFELRHGAVRAKVAKLGAGGRFIIDTIDAEVEVHGTAFRVALVHPDPDCGAGSRTRVSVSEGVVSVRPSGEPEERLYPGDEWPAGCVLAPAVAPQAAARGTPSAPLVSAAPAPAVGSPMRAATTSPVRRLMRRTPELRTAVLETHASPPRAPSVASPRSPSSSPPSSSPSSSPPAPPEDVVSSPLVPAADTPAAPQSPSALRAQNDMFAAAVRAKKRGHPAEAVKLFAALVRKYPESPLAESALAQRMKLLAATDPWSASDAATEYLGRFPGGFARADARRLAASQARP